MLRNDWCDLSTVLRTKVGWARQHTLVILACGGRGGRIWANLGYVRPCFKRPKVCVGIENGRARTKAEQVTGLQGHCVFMKVCSDSKDSAWPGTSDPALHVIPVCGPPPCLP